MTRINAATYDVTIPANDEVKLSCAGRYFACKDADGEFYLEYEEGGSLAFEGSMQHTPENEFKAVRLVNKSDDPIAATVLISDGPVGDSRSSFSSNDPIPVMLQSTGLVPDATASRVRLTGDATPIQIVAENANRRYVDMQNTGAANVWIWIDGVRARRIAPFEAWRFEGRNILSASADGSDGYISVLEV